MLTDVKKKLSDFDSFRATSHITLIKSKVAAIEQELGRQVQWSCREIGSLVSSDPNADPDDPGPELSLDMDMLGQVYLVVDALGVDFRNDLLERFAQLQCLPYDKLFAPGTPYCGLDCLERRYIWFERLLKFAEKKVSDIFPSHWRLSSYLFVEFRRRTKKHLLEILAERERENPDANTHVKTMLTALKSVVSFEKKMQAALNVRSPIDVEEEEFGDGLGDDSVDGGSSKSTRTVQESIADAFDNYLGPYVQLERETLEKLMRELIKAEENGTITEEKGTGEAFVSSRKMFEYIKASLKRCTEFSTGITYLSLSKEFRICLHHYSESLKFRCPQPVSFKKSKDDKSQVPIYELTKVKDALLCRIVTTAAYCIDTIPALETMMKKHVNPAYETEVDFSGQSDVFMDLVSFAFGVLVKGISERIDPSLRTMRHMNWSQVDTVGDDSKYMKEIFAVCSEVVPRVRSNVPAIYFQNFCTKLGTMLVDSFLENLWRLKRVAKTGGGQLSLDLMSMREYLGKMPNIRTPQGQDLIVLSKTYKTFIQHKTGHIENILKLVSADEEMVAEMFPLLWPDGEQADLDRIVGLRQGSGGFSDVIPGAAGVVLDKVGDHMKDKLSEAKDKLTDNAVGRAAKEAVGDLGRGIKSGVGTVTSVFSDIFTEEKLKAGSGSAGAKTSGTAGSGGAKPSTGNATGAVSRPASGSGGQAKQGASGSAHKAPGSTPGSATKKPEQKKASGGGGIGSFLFG